MKFSVAPLSRSIKVISAAVIFLDAGFVYATRKSTIEPVFGIIKSVMGFRQFLLRGLDAVKGEWNLICIAFNLKKLYALSI